MDISALESALPGATVDALAAVTSSSEAYVSADRSRVGQSSVEAWWRLVGISSAGARLGRNHVEAEYELMIRQAGATDSQLGVMAEEIRSAFHGAKNPPGVARHLKTEVSDLEYLGDSETDRAVLVTVTFMGEEE